MSCNYVNRSYPNSRHNYYSVDFNDQVTRPVRLPEYDQEWHATPSNPYPMNFMDAPSPSHQINVIYNGQPMLQGLDIVRGPMMFPVKRCQWYPRGPIMYPTTHSIPGPYLQTYIALAGKN